MCRLPIAVSLIFVLLMLSVIIAPATVSPILLVEGAAQVSFWAAFVMLVLGLLLPLLASVLLNSHWRAATLGLMTPLYCVRGGCWRDSLFGGRVGCRSRARDLLEPA